jgi:DNA-binding MarR family transcriptional regulator
MATSKRNNAPWTPPPEIGDLTDFRYHLRRFLSFSEITSEAAGISAQQYQLLQIVAAVPADRECNISYIAERMLLRHNSAVELVDRAVRSGLVRRVADENDHRRSLVQVTSKGGDLVTRLVAKHLANVRGEGPDIVRVLQKILNIKPSPSRKSEER